MEAIVEDFKLDHRPPFSVYPSLRKNRGARASNQVTWRMSQPKPSYVRLYGKDGELKAELIEVLTNEQISEFAKIDIEMIRINQTFALVERCRDQYKESIRRLEQHNLFIGKNAKDD